MGVFDLEKDAKPKTFASKEEKQNLGYFESSLQTLRHEILPERTPEQSFQEQGRKAPEASSSGAQHNIPVETAQAADEARRRLQKPNPAFRDALALKRDWETLSGNSISNGILTLDRQGVKLLKEINVEDLGAAHRIETLKISGIDLSSVPDLADRLGHMVQLKTLDLRGCKIGNLDVNKLPTSIKSVNLRHSIVPLPVCERLRTFCEERGVPTQNRGMTDLEQIRSYEERSKIWAEERSASDDEKRKEARGNTLDFLDGKPHAPTPNLQGLKLQSLDRDFHAMIAGRLKRVNPEDSELDPNGVKYLNLSGNALGVKGSLDLSRFAQITDLEYLDLSNNGITQVHNEESLAALSHLKAIDFAGNNFTSLPKNIDRLNCEVSFEQCLSLSEFSRSVDAPLINMNKGKDMIRTDAPASDMGSLLTYQYGSNVAEAITNENQSIREIESKIAEIDENPALRDDKDVQEQKRSWDAVKGIFTTQAHANALRAAVFGQGPIGKPGRLERFQRIAELATTIACERAVTLHDLPAQASVQLGTHDRYKTLGRIAQAFSLAGDIATVPVAKDVLKAGGQGGTALAGFLSNRESQAFHDGLARVFSREEMETVEDVLPMALALTLGEQLSSGAPVKKGENRFSGPVEQGVGQLVDFVTESMSKGVKKVDDAEIRAFREAAYLMADIAKGLPFGTTNPKELSEKLYCMSTEDKIQKALEWWAAGNNAGKEHLPFRDSYVLQNSQKMAGRMAKHFTLTGLQTAVELSDLKRDTIVKDGVIRQQAALQHDIRKNTRELLRDLGKHPRHLDDPSGLPSHYGPDSPRSTPPHSGDERKGDRYHRSSQMPGTFPSQSSGNAAARPDQGPKAPSPVVQRPVVDIVKRNRDAVIIAEARKQIGDFSGTKSGIVVWLIEEAKNGTLNDAKTHEYLKKTVEDLQSSDSRTVAGIDYLLAEYQKTQTDGEHATQALQAFRNVINTNREGADRAGSSYLSRASLIAPRASSSREIPPGSEGDTTYLPPEDSEQQSERKGQSLFRKLVTRR